MHEPTMQTRPIAGAALITASSVPGTPIASNTTGHAPAVGRRPRFHRILGRGIDRDARTHRERDRAAARREVGDDDRLDALPAQLGDDRETDRSRAEHDRGFRGRDRRTRATAWRPTAIGSVSAARRWSRPFGTFMHIAAESRMRSAYAPL